MSRSLIALSLVGMTICLTASSARADDASNGESLQTLAIDRLRPGKYQPRTRMDSAALDELAVELFRSYDAKGSSEASRGVP